MRTVRWGIIWNGNGTLFKSGAALAIGRGGEATQAVIRRHGDQVSSDAMRFKASCNRLVTLRPREYASVKEMNLRASTME